MQRIFLLSGTLASQSTISLGCFLMLSNSFPPLPSCLAVVLSKSVNQLPTTSSQPEVKVSFHILLYNSVTFKML